MASISFNVPPNDTFPNASIDRTDAYTDAAVKTMFEAFGLIPKTVQKDVLIHLYAMADSTNPLNPAPVFFSLPTGGGKSIIHDTFGASCGGECSSKSCTFYTWKRTAATAFT